MDQNAINALAAAASMINSETVAAVILTAEPSGVVNMQVHGAIIPVVFMERALHNHITKVMTAGEVNLGAR